MNAEPNTRPGAVKHTASERVVAACACGRVHDAGYEDDSVVLIRNGVVLGCGCAHELAEAICDEAMEKQGGR
jgi:hypothetical protein